MQRRTKIIATLGPACSEKPTLEALIDAGADVLRINFSHASHLVKAVVGHARQYAQKIQKPLGIMADLQGPKIRIGKLPNGEKVLTEDEAVTLTTDLSQTTAIPVTYANLCHEIFAQDRLLLDDGLIELEVLSVTPPCIHCRVIEGGILRDNKGLNRKGGGLAARALTTKDIEDLKLAIDLEVDFIALSFVKDASDIDEAKALLKKFNAPDTPIIAKIERFEALNQLSEIIKKADAIMVARGDLAVEVGAAEVPGLQKKIIEETRKRHKIAITATQMMESMISSPQPTRAEVSDVANAILDGSDAVMLSAETARGQYPIKVIQMVDKVCKSAEKNIIHGYTPQEENCCYTRSDEAIAIAAMHTANHFPIQAIVSLTESGATPLSMSRFHSLIPIIAITTNERTFNRLSLVQNVIPLRFDFHAHSLNKINAPLLALLKEKKLITDHGYVLVTRGRQWGLEGGTNQMELVSINSKEQN